MILDRDPDSCSALLRELAALGREAVTADTPGELVRRLRGDEHYETAIVDLELGPEDDYLDGVDLLVHLAQEHPGIRRVLMSSHPGAPRAPRTDAVPGVHAVLAKPFTRASLRRALGQRD
ncbi:MAG: hypothetical protein ABI867_02855 [Kofleriaceae bacterium]